MHSTPVLETPHLEKREPLCPVFGTCGGCAYQDISYEAELRIKEEGLKKLLCSELGIPEGLFRNIVPSPEPYHYRHRLDLTLKRSKGQVLFGFQSSLLRQMVPIEACAIARKEVSEFLPRLREEALQKLPSDYRTANLVVRTDDEGKVFWGGIGRRSLQMLPKNYFWTEIESRKIFYSLETFFQANLGILPALIQTVRGLLELSAESLFLDLYSGVGLFGISFAGEAAKIIMIEDCAGSVNLAKYNIAYHQFEHVEIRPAKVEAELALIDFESYPKISAMIDPPRQGLSPYVAEKLSQCHSINPLLYLSCHPVSLARDLKIFQKAGWKIDCVIPFDFFPKTSHIETLVRLRHEA